MSAITPNQSPSPYSFLFTDIEGSTRLWEQQPEAMRVALARQLECLSFIAREQNQPERAIRLMGAAEALRELANSPMTGVERIEYDQEATVLHGQLSLEAFNSEWAKGRSLTMDQAIDFALEGTDQARPF